MDKMVDLISRNSLIKALSDPQKLLMFDGRMAQESGEWGIMIRLSDVMAIAMSERTIEAMTVVHAKNVTPTHYADEFLCENCGFCCEITELRHDDENGFGIGEATAHEYECKFCPDCGAKIVR